MKLYTPELVLEDDTVNGSSLRRATPLGYLAIPFDGRGKPHWSTENATSLYFPDSAGVELPRGSIRVPSKAGAVDGRDGFREGRWRKTLNGRRGSGVGR